MIYLKVRRIVGESMYPTLKPNQLVLGVNKKPKIKAVAILFFKDREVIKRITNISSAGLFIEGDNKNASTDSRSYGLVPVQNYIATIIWPRKI